MAQEQMERPVQKKKKQEKLEFSPEKVFSVEPAEDVQLDVESSRYTARKGEGGDRRS